jgi:uncharacterized membrane protein
MIFKNSLYVYFQTNGTPAADQATDPVWLDTLKIWSGYLATGVEVGAALIIGIAAIEAFIATLIVFFHRQSPPEAKENLRLRLGRWLAVALEFGLAADILRTAVAPSWTEIGQLVVIAFLRTALNFFLQQEIDRATVRESAIPSPSSSSTSLLKAIPPVSSGVQAVNQPTSSGAENLPRSEIQPSSNLESRPR